MRLLSISLSVVLPAAAVALTSSGKMMSLKSFCTPTGPNAPATSLTSRTSGTSRTPRTSSDDCAANRLRICGVHRGAAPTATAARRARVAAEVAILLCALVERGLLIDRHHDRRVSGALRSLEQLAARIEIVAGIELPPQLPLGRLRDLLHRLRRIVAENHRGVRARHAGAIH